MIFGFSLLSNAQNGLAFDGADDYVQTTFTGPTSKRPRTIECWVKPPLVTKGIKMFFDYGSNSNGGGFGLGMTEGYLSAHVGGFSVTTNGLVADEEWHHIAFLYDSLESYNFRIYLDGEFIDSFNASVTINTRSTIKLRFGVGVVSGTNYWGLMDEVRVWNYARTLMQLKNNSQNELCTRPKGLVAYYKLNEGIAEGNNLKVKTAYDFGPGKKNGTLNNFYLDKNLSNWVKGNKFQVGYVSASIADTACNVYTSPSGKFKWTKSATYTDTIPNYMGCDSAITIALKVYPIPQKSITVKACEAYTSPSGKYVWTKSGTYGDKLKNPKGCDTNVTIKLTIYNGSTNSINVKACSHYTSPSGKYTWNTSGDFTDTIQTVNGCDSILNIKLVLQNSSSIQKVKTCGSFVSPSGKYTWSQSGFYYDVVKNYRSCDSVIGIDLTILEPSFAKLFITECGNYITPSGKYSYHVSGTYFDTLTNFAGCDSIIKINLTIIEPTSY